MSILAIAPVIKYLIVIYLQLSRPLINLCFCKSEPSMFVDIAKLDLFMKKDATDYETRNIKIFRKNYTFAIQTVTTMKLRIESGMPADIDELEKLYDDLNDHLSATTNYPGWMKGIYPIREDAVAGIKANNLFVAKYDGKIVGSIILDHHPEEAYNKVRWKTDIGYDHIFVMRTFVVHPLYFKKGIGHALLDHTLKLAHQSGIKSIRLDVYEKNVPAISLYEKYGFEYIDSVDLGLGRYGLDRFKLYEKII